MKVLYAIKPIDFYFNYRPAKIQLPYKIVFIRLPTSYVSNTVLNKPLSPLAG